MWGTTALLLRRLGWQSVVHAGITFVIHWVSSLTDNSPGNSVDRIPMIGMYGVSVICIWNYIKAYFVLKLHKRNLLILVCFRNNEWLTLICSGAWFASNCCFLCLFFGVGSALLVVPGSFLMAVVVGWDAVEVEGWSRISFLISCFFASLSVITLQFIYYSHEIVRDKRKLF